MRNNFHFVSMGFVLRYLPEGVSAFEFTEEAIACELKLRRDLDVHYKALWIKEMELGSSRSCVSIDAGIGASIWLCRGRMPPATDWPTSTCFDRRPDYSVPLPPDVSDEKLADIARDIFTEARMKGACRTIASSSPAPKEGADWDWGAKVATSRRSDPRSRQWHPGAAQAEQVD